MSIKMTIPAIYTCISITNS